MELTIALAAALGWLVGTVTVSDLLWHIAYDALGAKLGPKVGFETNDPSRVCPLEATWVGKMALNAFWPLALTAAIFFLAIIFIGAIVGTIIIIITTPALE